MIYFDCLREEKGMQANTDPQQINKLINVYMCVYFLAQWIPR